MFLYISLSFLTKTDFSPILPIFCSWWLFFDYFPTPRVDEKVSYEKWNEIDWILLAARGRVVPDTKPVFGGPGTWLERAKCAFSKNQSDFIIFVQNFVQKYVQNFVFFTSILTLGMPLYLRNINSYKLFKTKMKKWVHHNVPIKPF